MRCTVRNCKNVSTVGFKRCEICRAYVRVASKIRRRNRFLLGLCSITGCLLNHEPNRLMCAGHLNKQAKACQRYEQAKRSRPKVQL